MPQNPITLSEITAMNYIVIGRNLADGTQRKEFANLTHKTAWVLAAQLIDEGARSVTVKVAERK